MYGVTGEKHRIFVESDAFLYNLGDPTIVTRRSYIFLATGTIRIEYWLWNYIGLRPRLSDSLIDKITTLSWKYMTEWRDYSNPRDDSLDV